jgi:hypothetical protein
MPNFANGVGIVCRYVSVDYFWQCLLYKFFSDSRIRLQRTYAGLGPTTVLDIDIPGALSNGDVLSVSYCGDDFEVFVNDVSLGTYDASVASQNYGTKSGMITQTGSWFATYDQRLDDFTVESEEGCPNPSADWTLPPLSWTATGEVEPFNPTGGVMTKRFDDGEGSQWFMVAPVVDSDNELRSKTIVAAHAMGRFTNANMQMYTWDVTEGVNLNDLEAGTNSSTGDIPIDDSTEVAQSVREPMNCKNAVLSTIRIEGDDRGQTVRDEIHELVVEQAIQGVRR